MYQPIQIFRNTTVINVNLEINKVYCENCMKSTHDYVRKCRICNVTAGGRYGMTKKSLDIRGSLLAFILP